MAKKAKFHFNPETLSFERVETSARNILKKIFIHLFSSAFVGFFFFLLFSFLIDSPEEKQLRKDLKTMKIQYHILDKKVDQLTKVSHDLQQRDNNLYRVIFQAEPLPDYTTGYNHDNVLIELSDKSSTKILNETSHKVDMLSKQIYSQINSYDEIVELLKTNETKLQNIPAIQPILNKDLTKVASGFGYRIDPVYHTRKMHTGMDFTAPTGTDIFATGNGVVTFAGWKQGYGNTIIIDHGFGYETLYAHLKKIKVHVRQKINRTDIIGTVGSTGKSTGPHLHYEVIFKGQHVDPLNYYFLDLSPEEYDKMIQLAQNAGQVLD